MAKSLKKSTKKILSVGFHLALLTGMVLIYDGAKNVGEKLGWIEAEEEELVDVKLEDWSLDTKMDSDLAKLIDKNEDGYLFKRNMAFPPHLKVITTDRQKVLDARVVGKSPFGEVRAGKMSFKTTEVMEYETAGRAARITMKKDVIERILSAEQLKEKRLKIEKLKSAGEPIPVDKETVTSNLQGKVVQFGLEGRQWKATKSGQFATAAWGKKLEGKVAGLLVENGLVPRPRWFGEKRLKEGDTLTLKNETLGLILDHVSEGEIEMTFRGVEGVHGHPCGVFDIKGRIKPDPTVNELGQTSTSEISIESGKAWLSVLYPVVLRVRSEDIESTDLTEGGKNVFKLQGPVERDVHHQWIAMKRKQATAVKKASTVAE